eukprot:830704-Prorocentrum_minimum.AAC.3
MPLGHPQIDSSWTGYAHACCACMREHERAREVLVLYTGRHELIVSARAAPAYPCISNIIIIYDIRTDRSSGSAPGSSRSTQEDPGANPVADPGVDPEDQGVDPSIATRKKLIRGEKFGTANSSNLP